MKQLLVLSGKGGTGKTTVAAALIELSGCRAFADCPFHREAQGGGWHVRKTCDSR